MSRPDFAALAREGCEECPPYRQFTNSTYKIDMCRREDFHDKVAAAMERGWNLNTGKDNVIAQGYDPDEAFNQLTDEVNRLTAERDALAAQVARMGYADTRDRQR